MNELYETVYQSRPPVIDGLLYSGTYLFAGAPKVGKSFFMAQLAYHISTGQPLWNYEVHQGMVLYLALEDDYQRLQERMSRMFGVEGTDNLHFAVYAKQLGAGLDEQLEKFIREHHDTRLIIIDTLQKIREVSTDAYSSVSYTHLKGRPCWGRQPQLPGAKPPHPLGEPTALSHQRGESVIVGYYTSRRKCLPRTSVHF